MLARVRGSKFGAPMAGYDTMRGFVLARAISRTRSNFKLLELKQSHKSARQEAHVRHWISDIHLCNPDGKFEFFNHILIAPNILRGNKVVHVVSTAVYALSLLHFKTGQSGP